MDGPSRKRDRTALVTGIAGQDGSYLAELLLANGYRVVGVPRSGNPDLHRIAHIQDRLELRAADLLDEASLVALLRETTPTEIYNLAGHSFVPTSWDRPEIVGDATGLGTARLLDAITITGSDARFYQASSSEIFGRASEAPQNEQTPVNPRNPYGAAKAFAHFMTRNAREQYGLFAVAGILYNHESPRRGTEFLTRKVTDGAARVALGLVDSISVGSLDARRDWGFAGDYVRAMWLMLQQPEPSDFVIATGVTHSVRDVCRIAFERVGLEYERHVVVDPAFVRPVEAVPLVGDASRARAMLDWRPEMSFTELIQSMVDADLERHRAARE